MKSALVPAFLCALLCACAKPPDAALGTLERDRITLPAPVAERIAQIPVEEGATVAQGEVVLVLEGERTQARLDAVRADVARLQGALEEARNGPRPERIDEARQRLARADSLALNARREHERVDAVVGRGLLPRAERDRALAASQAADADVRAARAVLAELEHGTRSETVAQAEAALAGAQALQAAAAVDAERTQVRAPRDALVDSLPFEVGDQVTVGTPLAILLVGDAPYARVYVPQPLRLDLHVGSRAQVHVQGSDVVFAGTVRSVRSEPSFTPYYALSGDDASQLSYLAEVQLDADAAALPVGIPVRVTFDAPAR
jgi:HlyD family secretion protein